MVLYGDTSELGLHTNIVVSADGDTVTTVGGNQPDGGITYRVVIMLTVPTTDPPGLGD